MKIELEIPPFLEKHTDEEMIKKIKICSFIPYMEKDLIGQARIAEELDISQNDTMEMFCSINYDYNAIHDNDEKRKIEEMERKSEKKMDELIKERLNNGRNI